jgi:hypothetical protein
MNNLTLPAPLDQTVFHTRKTVQEYRQAVANYYTQQREIEHQARVAADNEFARDRANAQREQTDAEYDAIKLGEWTAARNKVADRIAKEKTDALAKIAYMTSSPPVAEIMCRSEYNCIQEIIHFASLGYTMNDSGMLAFGNGYFHIEMHAPTSKPSKAGK